MFENLFLALCIVYRRFTISCAAPWSLNVKLPCVELLFYAPLFDESCVPLWCDIVRGECWKNTREACPSKTQYRFCMSNSKPKISIFSASGNNKKPSPACRYLLLYCRYRLLYWRYRHIGIGIALDIQSILQNWFISFWLLFCDISDIFRNRFILVAIYFIIFPKIVFYFEMKCYIFCKQFFLSALVCYI